MTLVTQESQSEARVEATPARTIGLSFIRRAHRYVLCSNAVPAQMMRFGIVGFVATVADVITLHVLANILQMNPAGAAAIGFALGLTISYVLSIRWVFSSRTLGNAALEFAAFAAIGIVGLGLTELIIHLGIREFGREHLLHAKYFAIVTVFSWNFGARRVLLFRGGK